MAGKAVKVYISKTWQNLVNRGECGREPVIDWLNESWRTESFVNGKEDLIMSPDKEF